MHGLIDLLGGSLPFLLILASLVLYLQGRSDGKKTLDEPGNIATQYWDDLDDLRLTYAAMPLDRLIPLYCQSRPDEGSRQLMAHELKTRGWVEKTLANGRTVLVEPRPDSHQLRLTFSEEKLARIRASLRR